MIRSMSFTLYQADCLGTPSNCMYPHAMRVTGTASLKDAVCKDYVCAEYRDGHRKNANFIQSDCLALECDNTHSDNPEDWVTPKHLAQALPDVFIAIHYSRNHMKPKNGKAPRPRLHVFIQIDKQTSAEAYRAVKSLLQQHFPFFDENAMDAARFFFGTKEPDVEIIPGTKNLSEFIEDYALDMAGTDSWADAQFAGSTIPEGSRNATMSHYAGKVLKRLGDTDEAYQQYLRRADCCVPPLEDAELGAIWRSALSFYSRIQQQDGYVPPDQYGQNGFVYAPDDQTDVGQARALGKFFSNKLRYSPATDYIRYDGACWQETKPGSRAVAHELTDLQLAEANAAIEARLPAYEATGAADVIAMNPRKKAVALMSPEQRDAYQRYNEAVEYKAYALGRRDTKYVTATLKEAQPVLEIDPALLDRDCYLLCTPEATYDLRKGLAGRREHDPNDFITHRTSVSPGDKGADIWQEALNTFFCGDQDLIRLRPVCGRHRVRRPGVP